MRLPSASRSRTAWISDDRSIQHESIFLPLSDDGENVDLILVFTVYSSAPLRYF
ncbi:MAG: hypothetical protein R3D05_07940 [Dongiaceae bacterium]